MEEKVQRLEEMVAFQDDLIERLNEQVGEQQVEFHRLTKRLDKLEAHVRSMQPSLTVSGKDDTPPPHY